MICYSMCFDAIIESRCILFSSCQCIVIVINISYLFHDSLDMYFNWLTFFWRVCGRIHTTTCLRVRFQIRDIRMLGNTLNAFFKHRNLCYTATYCCKAFGAFLSFQSANWSQLYKLIIRLSFFLFGAFSPFFLLPVLNFLFRPCICFPLHLRVTLSLYTRRFPFTL